MKGQTTLRQVRPYHTAQKFFQGVHNIKQDSGLSNQSRNHTHIGQKIAIINRPDPKLTMALREQQYSYEGPERLKTDGDYEKIDTLLSQESNKLN